MKTAWRKRPTPEWKLRRKRKGQRGWRGRRQPRTTSYSHYWTLIRERPEFRWRIIGRGLRPPIYKQNRHSRYRHETWFVLGRGRERIYISEGMALQMRKMAGEGYWGNPAPGVSKARVGTAWVDVGVMDARGVIGVSRYKAPKPRHPGNPGPRNRLGQFTSPPQSEAATLLTAASGP